MLRLERAIFILALKRHTNQAAPLVVFIFSKPLVMTDLCFIATCNCQLQHPASQMAQKAPQSAGWFLGSMIQARGATKDPR